MSKVLTLGYEFEHDYSLIAINSTLEDYRLAYLLNKKLNINLICEPKGLEFTDKNCSFIQFNYYCNIEYYSWSLIANKHIFTVINTDKNYLFEEDSKISYLINEKKEVDYFLKFSGDIDINSLHPLIQNIKKIQGVVTSYTINPLTLKSKDYLIF
ncbi:MAG TPA: IPExxxVDY family protein [Flavobacteriaceae bacterium]|jgi:hypothetical protein|nr:IPExxxVDY family protein [Flavobacteriaceae bacterium]HBS12650.1 IPExxxVDY family protein [Flavobacteriaceae bacterium]